MADNYKTIVVGSDGSKSSLLAVERAAKIAAAFGSTLVIGTAYYENEEEAAKTLRQDSVTILGDDKALENLEGAAEHARAAGAPDVQTATRPGTPVEAVSRVTVGCVAAMVRRVSSTVATRTGDSARSACHSAWPHPRGA